MMPRIRSLALASAALLAVLTPRVTSQEPPRRFVYTGDSDFAPYDFIDAQGRPTGFNVELIRALAKDAGVEVEIRLGEWDRARADFDAGRADLIGLSYSEERERAYLWLARTWVMHQCLLFLPRNSPTPSGMAGLAGETIAVQERSAVAEFLASLPAPRPRIIQTATQAEALHLLRDGGATGVGGNSLSLRYAATRLGMRELIELPVRAVPYGIVSQKGRGSELSWVPASMAHLRDAGTLEALAEKYLSTPRPPRTWWDYRYFALALVGVLMAAGVAALVWNRSLLAKMRNRTAELEKSTHESALLTRSLIANEERFQSFLNVTSEGIARAELAEPLAIDQPESEQITHFLRHTRLAEGNRTFARMLGKADIADLIGARLQDLIPAEDLAFGLPAFIRSGYRLTNSETSRTLKDGRLRWGSSNVVGVIEGGLLKGIWLTQRDVTHTKTVEEDLRVRGRILEAVAFSSARLLEPGPWKAHVAEVLSRLGEAVGVGCAYLCENVEMNGALTCNLRHEWTIPGVPALMNEPMFQQFPWPERGPVKGFLEQRQVAAVLVRDLPEQAQEFLARMGLKSLLIVPIFVDDKWWGLLGFGDYARERRWSEAEIEALKTAGVAIGAALLREQVEDAVHQSEQKHRDIVKFAPAGIYQSARDGTLIMANREFARLLGYENLNDVYSMNLGRDLYFDAAERERLIAEYERVGHGARLEVKLKRRDGSPFWGELSAHSVQDASGQTLYFEGFILDISSRKAAEAELRASEERYRLMFDANPVPMVVCDLESLELIAANEAAVAQYGYRRDELVGLSIRELAFDDDEGFKLFVANRFGPRPDLLRVGLRPQRRKDGSRVEVDITSLNMSLGGKRVNLLLNRDVTAEREAEAARERFGQALERAAEEWHRTFDAVDVSILVLDRTGRLTRVNRSAMTMLGPAFSDVLAHTIAELSDREPWRSASDMVSSVVRDGSAVSTRAVDGQGGRTWEVSAYLAEVGQGGEERIILIVRDISRLVALQESLRHSETMSAMGSLVAGVAHEVRNPLFSISATVDALESELGDRNEYAELTELLRSQVSRLRQLMRDLLDYGKPPVLRRAAIHPGEILRRAMRGCANLSLEREVKLVDDVPEQAPVLYVDGGRMEQVFQNLLANAIQHSPREATVRAIMRLSPEGELPLEFVIEDEGAGLPAGEIGHVFEPFFSRRKGGTGLGLSVVQRIVEAHGGRVAASNREGGGAIFTVRLPATVIDNQEAV